MFWDRVANIYDLTENLFNGKVNRQLCLTVASYIDGQDRVLECACGTGMISKGVGGSCKTLIATDFSEKMLERAGKKCRGMKNIRFESGNILKLAYQDGSFDKVVAGNVIHLLDDPYQALREMVRVCRPGGQVVVPTYMIAGVSKRNRVLIRLFNRLGAHFKREFSYPAYQDFFRGGGYEDVEFVLIEGNMPCAVAVITV